MKNIFGIVFFLALFGLSGLVSVEASTQEERQKLFSQCYKDPAADTAKYGHGGNCYAHCLPGECERLGFVIRTNLFNICRNNPNADAQRYGHGGNCCAHITRSEGDLVNRQAGKRLCNFDTNPNVSLEDLVEVYNAGCTVALAVGYTCVPIPQ
ncbi:hypothetical protein [Candidatus Thiodiazotropha sp. LNASS1]|uniref:hypothetical protein n=1 Tax=Candidatus Thiodiazotropha sp. LNASS1 TaxID=3096260 RepID=UPI003493F2F8